MIQLGRSLTFSDRDLEALGSELRDMHQDMESSQEKLFEKVQKAWSWYEAEKRVQKKSTPFDGASNVVVPLVQIHSDATAARHELLLRATNDVWVAKSENEEFARTGLVRDIPAFLNWVARTELEWDDCTSEWILEIDVIGQGVLALEWSREEMTFLLPDGRPETVRTKNGPVLEHVPREHCLWDLNYRAWNAPLFSRKTLLTWSDVVHQVNGGGWDWEVVKGLKGRTVQGTESIGQEVVQDKLERGGQESRTWSHEARGLYDFRAVWVEWPVVARAAGAKAPQEMEEGDVLSQIVVIQHRETGKVVKVSAKPYAIPGNPFYDGYFKKRSGTYSSRGLAWTLADLQEVASTLVNQSLDAVTLANNFTGATNDPNFAKAKIELGKFTYSTDAGSIVEFGKGKNIAPDLALLNMVNVFAERLTGINDPALGRETRMGGHPAPATSTLSLLQEGKKMDIPAIRSIRQCIRHIGHDMIALYRQYGDDQIVRRVTTAMGQEDAARLVPWLFTTGSPTWGNVELDLAAISETMNPDIERQKAMVNFQITGNFYAIVTQYLGVISNPQAPEPLVMAMSKGLEALHTSYLKILENNDVDDLRAFALELDQLRQAAVAGRGGAQRAAAQSPFGMAAGGAQAGQGGNGAAIGSGLGF